jgi:hypothetical protein
MLHDLMIVLSPRFFAACPACPAYLAGCERLRATNRH